MKLYIRSNGLPMKRNRDSNKGVAHFGRHLKGNALPTQNLPSSVHYMEVLILTTVILLLQDTRPLETDIYMELRLYSKGRGQYTRSRFVLSNVPVVSVTASVLMLHCITYPSVRMRGPYW